MCECFKNNLKNILSVVIIALLIAGMYQILKCAPESVKNSIEGYFFFLFIVLIVVVFVVLIMKYILFKDEKLDGLLKVFEILDSLADFSSVVLVYFGISTKSWSNTEMVFLIIICFKLFYISLNIIESNLSKVFKKSE